MLMALLSEAELEAIDDTHGATAFLNACLGGNTECIAILVEAGCDTTAKNYHGQTALMLALAPATPRRCWQCRH